MCDLIKTADVNQLDAWSINSLEKFYTELQDFIITLKTYPNNYIVLLDKTEALPYVEGEQPPADIEQSQRHLKEIIEGYYVGKFLIGEEKQLADNIVRETRLLLESLDYVEKVYDFGSNYEAKSILLDGEIIISFYKDVYIKDEFLDKSSDGFVYNYDIFERNIRKVVQPFSMSARRVFRSSTNCLQLEFFAKLKKTKFIKE